jgi:hypothetical protein
MGLVRIRQCHRRRCCTRLISCERRIPQKLPDANLVNFGPAILGIAIFGLNILAAALALVIASVLLFRGRWKRAGFALAFGITVVGWYVKALFY